MTDRIALITGANQGIGKEVATRLAERGVVVLMGSRDLERGRTAAAEIGNGARAVQLDVTDPDSIARAASLIETEFGRLDLLVNNAGVVSAGAAAATPEERAARRRPSTASLEEIRAVWEVNVFGVLAMYQAALPLLRKGVDARIVNVSSAVGSLTANADPRSPYHATFGPVYPASKAAENAMALAMMIESESTDIAVNLVSPGYTSTALNGYAGTESIEDGAREVVRVALLDANGPSGTFTMWKNAAFPW